MFDQRIMEALKEKREKGLYRSPPIFSGREGKFLIYQGKKVLNFGSNDYLGLGTESSEIPISYSSSSSSQLVTGTTTLMREVEKEYADYFGYQSALFFSSGFLANYALLSTLFHQDDLIFMDKRVHASMVEGVKVSKAQLSLFNHNDLKHLKQRLSKSKSKSDSQQKVALLAESLYSMDGDKLDLTNLIKLKQESPPLFTIIDEAHSFSVLGNKGRGLAKEVADIAIGTLSKGFGLHGAFILLPSIYKEYLINFCSPLIYTTALPPHFYLMARSRLQQVEKMDDEREKLTDLSSWCSFYFKEKKIPHQGDAHILSIQIGDEEKTTKIAEKLLRQNIYVFPARYPTVPSGKSILRLGLTSLHQKEDIKILINELEKIVDEVQI